MTTPKALPPGTNHHAVTKHVAHQIQSAADVAIEANAGPRPAGPKRVMNAELPMKTIHRVQAK